MQSNLILFNRDINDVIDVEILYSSFRNGFFIAQVKDNSFDEDIFEFIHSKEDHTGWIQLLVGESCANAYVSDGQVVFVSPEGELHISTESAVKRIEDLILLRQGEEQSCLQQSNLLN